MFQAYSRRTVHGIKHLYPLGGAAGLTIQEAEKYGVQYEEIPGTRIIKFTYKGVTAFMRAQLTSHTSAIAYYSATDKEVSRNLLLASGVSIPKGFNIVTSDPSSYLHEVFDALQKPLVIKPSHGSKGESVFINIQNYEEYQRAVRTTLAYSTHSRASAIVEEMFHGNEYRILATRDKVVGIAYRRPANVVGDGVLTIAQLIEQKNSDPRRSDDPEQPLVKIKIDQHVLGKLAADKKTLADIPHKGERVYLRYNSNVSTGGESIDMTEKAHPSVIDVALRAVRAIPGLDFAGVDFMTKDITAQQTPDTYVIVEVNESPGFSIHDLPYEGESRHGAREFLRLLFPEFKDDFV